MAGAAPAAAAAAMDAPASIRVRRAASDWWPERHALAVLWEQDPEIRDIFRKNQGQLLGWPSPQLVGVASMRALAMNVPVLKTALTHWGETVDFPKSLSVDYLKQEASNLLTAHCDHTVHAKFMPYIWHVMTPILFLSCRWATCMSCSSRDAAKKVLASMLTLGESRGWRL